VALRENPDMVSWWAGEGAKSRIDDPEYPAQLERLDEGLFEKATKMTATERIGQTFWLSNAWH
jgi:hypothetical protein